MAKSKESNPVLRVTYSVALESKERYEPAMRRVIEILLGTYDRMKTKTPEPEKEQKGDT